MDKLKSTEMKDFKHTNRDGLGHQAVHCSVSWGTNAITAAGDSAFVRLRFLDFVARSFHFIAHSFLGTEVLHKSRVLSLVSYHALDCVFFTVMQISVGFCGQSGLGTMILRPRNITDMTSCCW